MIELSRTQDEEVGDGTTSVIILAGEILAYSLPLLEKHIHPVVIIRAFKQALDDALETIKKISVPVDVTNEAEMMSIVKTSIGTKFVSRWSDLMCRLALDAVRTVAVTAEEENGVVGGGENKGLDIKTIDIKRYARVEKVPGGEIEESRVLRGVMVNKDVTHPKMRRRIENPRIVLLDCPLEYKKGESQTNIEISREEDWNRVLQIEEEQIKAMCEKIVSFKPDVVFTEKGVSGGCCVFTADDRPRTALPSQGRPSHHCDPPREEIRQQPYRPRRGGYDRQPCRGPARLGRRHWMRPVPH